MEFANHNDLDLILKLEHHGRPIRVSDCVRFAVKVWTQNANNFLLFTSRDVIKDGRADRLVIPGYQMAALESGVIVYEYSYSLNDRHFKPFEGHNHQDHTKRVVTDIYWKNANYNQIPSNPINFESLNRLRNLIEQEVSDRENAIIDVKDYFNESFINALKAEVERSTAKDEELEKLIKENKEIADGCVDALLEKIEAEIKRSNEVDIELFNAIKKAGETSNADKEETDNKIEETNNDLADEIERAKGAEKELNDAITAEADRAKAAEREINTALTDEVSRAKTKEAEIDATISAEVARAKVVEGALSDAVDAVRDKANQIACDLAAEVSRSNQKDYEHTAALNDETTRAKAAEKAIVDRLDVIEGDKDVVGSLAHTLEDAKHYTDDAISKANADSNAAIADNATAIANEISRATATEKANADAITALDGKVDGVKTVADKAAADITAEVSRATTKEGELEAALNVVNGDKDTIGSIAHALDDSKHYTDDEIAKLKVSTATDLSDALKPYATKVEVDGRIEGIIGTAPAALDTLGEIADRLSEDSDAIKAINAVLSGKANAADVYTKAEADAQHQTMTTSVNALDGKVDAEVNRAKAAEKVNADNITAVSAKVDAVKATADKAAADLVDEVNRAKGVEADLTTKVSAVEAKATTNADAITNLVDDVATLETTLNGAKTDLNALSNDLASEVSRATTKEGELESGVTANASKIADLTTRTTAVEGEVKTIKTDLSNVKSAMDVVNGDENTIGSIKHSTADAKHYTDDEIAKLTAKVEAEVTGFATKSEVAAVDAKVDNLKSKVDAIEAPDLSGYYDKAEVDQMIANVDVTDQLTDYAKTAETTCIKDENGNIITEMVIDNSEADDTIEVYTKQQCDEIFAKKGEVSGGGNVDLSGYATKNDLNAKANKSDVYTKSEVDALIPQIVTLTQAQYDALTVKAPNTLYIVNG